MKLLVINLKRSQDRREFMQPQLDKLGMVYEWFPAVDGQSACDLAAISRYDAALALRLLGHQLSVGEVGCFASHYMVWLKCVELGVPLLVLEDDVQIGAQFPESVALADEIIMDLRFIRLSGIWNCPFKFQSNLSPSHRLVRYLKGPVGAQCYAIAPSGAAALLRHATVWIDAVDKYIDAFWVHGLSSYAIHPFHVMHDFDNQPLSVIDETRMRKRHLLRRKFSTSMDRVRRELFNLTHK
jgi:glycosyl transferase family 25